ncbi:hypothetical protein J6590_046910 [Homalodisca vitripennis]|nr:hypothetical protein J6590_046910 [Homalodisca vitripennis]
MDLKQPKVSLSEIVPILIHRSGGACETCLPSLDGGISLKSHVSRSLLSHPSMPGQTLITSGTDAVPADLRWLINACVVDNPFLKPN